MLSRSVPAVLRTDALRLFRDQFLVGASAYILGCAIVLRWLVPWLQAELIASNAFDIGPYIPLGVSYFVVVNASVLTGMIGGFLLLETREERTVKALLVTPTPLAVPLATLGSVILTVGAGVTVTLAALLGVGVPPWPAVVAAAGLGAPTGIMMALFLATAASNKVEAFAVMKITSFLGLIPIGAFFLPEPWQFAAGVVPIYWACKIWWAAAEGGTWLWMLVPGLVVSAAWIAVLVPRFRAAAYR